MNLLDLATLKARQVVRLAESLEGDRNDALTILFEDGTPADLRTAACNVLDDVDPRRVAAWDLAELLGEREDAIYALTMQADLDTWDDFNPAI